VNTAADFHNALLAGTDEIAHLPILGTKPVSPDDARLAASRGVVVDTTCQILPTVPPSFVPPSELSEVLAMQLSNLKLLHKAGVKLPSAPTHRPTRRTAKSPICVA
jgi:hypothetical protein